MGDITSIEYRITQAYTRWGVSLRRKNVKEACGPCPFCLLADEDGFLVFADGGYWCRQCDSKGWLDNDKTRPLTEQEKLALRVARIEQEQREQAGRISRLEEMARCTDHLRYHESLTPEAREYWWGEGITDNSIERYLLGYCDRCPTYHQSGSYTIPVVNGGQLQNIRHRLANPDGNGKYRPHRAGLGQQLFNADLLDEEPPQVVVVEGEKKAIVLCQAGFPAVGISGKRAFRREWVDRFGGVKAVYIALDPDAQDAACRLGALFGERGRVCRFPVKPDDMIVQYGAGAEDIEAILRLARPAC